MKVDFDIDTEKLSEDVAKEVLKTLRPFLEGKGTNAGDEIFDVKSLATYLKVTPQWVYQRVRFMEIPFYKVGNFNRFKKGDIEAWLNEHKIMATEPCKAFRKRS